MTRDEAIVIIKEAKDIAEQYTTSCTAGHRYTEIAEAYQMAIMALTREGQQPCRFNPGVICNPATDRCYDCGWNPEISRLRLSDIQKDLHKEDQHGN